MSHNDSSDGFLIPASSAQGAGKEIASSDEAPIDQIESIRVAKHIKAQCRRTDLKYVIAILFFSPVPRLDESRAVAGWSP